MARGKSGPSQTPRSGGPSRGTTGRPAAKASAKGSAPARPPVRRKPGKSIVNQKQTPWGLIAVTAVIVLFAAAIIVAVIATHKSKPAANGGCSKMNGSNSTTYLNELACAKDISGVVFKPESERNHVTTAVTYDTTPPIGGNHSPYWADCSGTVYPNAIANENAVHMLEHGAVWITYNAKTLPPADVTTLAKLVNGQDRMAMSPYPGLDSPISIQSWGYQLKVSSASDPRIQKFIDALRYNPKTTPEYQATCSQPTFKAHPSTFGNPLSQPAA